MIKNIGKLKQWTGEKFGSAKTTLQTEDFQRLEVETERKRIAYEKLHASALLMQSQLVKKKISPEDNKSKRLPGDMFGVCMNNYGNEFTDDTPLGIAMINFGQAQSRLASYQEDYAEAMRSEYIEKLEEGLQQFKEYQALRKKLESRRLDYDSKLSRLQKSKKENPGLEQELQAAKMKFEDSEYDVIQKMASLQEFEDEHCQVLQNFLDVQYAFFTQSLETLNEVKSNWGTSVANSHHSLTARSNTMRRNPNGLSRTSSNNSTGADEGGNTAMNLLRSAAPRKLSIGRNGSTDSNSLSLASSARRVPSRNNSTFSDRDDLPVPANRVTPPPAPPVLPRRQSQAAQDVPMKNQRKAVYDFGGDNADELSFRIGDLIQVVEEVDEGWWLGEVIEPSGHVRRGIFPVNYTEIVQQQQPQSAGPPMPARPVMSHSNSTQRPQYIQEEENTTVYGSEPSSYYSQQQEDSSPFGDVNRTSSNNGSRGFSYNRPNQPSRTLSANTSNSGISPVSSPVPQYKSTAKRAPPPPPPSSRTPPATSSRGSNMKPSGVRTAPSTPQVHTKQSDGYFDSNTTPSCGDCGCDEFSANIFKKGHCNNCFHKHF